MHNTEEQFFVHPKPSPEKIGRVCWILAKIIILKLDVAFFSVSLYKNTLFPLF